MVNTLLEWWQEAPYKVLFYLKQPAEQNEKIPIMGHIIINRIISYSFVANDLSHSDWGHQSQINRLLGVYDILSANNLRTAFKSEILRKGKVTHSYWNRQSSFGTLSWNRSNYLYMFPGTSRANSFRKWILHTLNKCNNKSHFNNPVKFLVCPK